MSVPVRLRHPAVLLGVVLALFAGAATIRAAAAWTAASAPLVSKPPSVEILQSALAAEQARSISLQTQLDELTAGSTDLTAALQAARDRIAEDASQAEALQASLAAAKAKLTTLERSIQQAGAAPPAVSGPVAAVGRTGDGDHAGEHEEHEEDDDD
jgi:DNA repair exonuclease SbcCD ATPase subunit